jgi:arsenite methyltransferase
MPTKQRIDYGTDAPAVMRNLFIAGIACLLLSVFIPPVIHAGANLDLGLRIPLRWTGGFLIAQALLFLLYVKYGKYKHRDMMLALHTWRGDEQVLDVGCGRGLLLAGAAKHLTTGHATGIDIWSNVDMGGNSEAATEQNLKLEGVADQCTLISVGAQDMTFNDASFDIIVSNLCLHNIYDKPTRMAALDQIVRVLKPGGIALISDYKKTGEYAEWFRAAGLSVTSKRGSFLTTFPPLNVIIARKPV